METSGCTRSPFPYQEVKEDDPDEFRLVKAVGKIPPEYPDYDDDEDEDMDEDVDEDEADEGNEENSEDEYDDDVMDLSDM